MKKLIIKIFYLKKYTNYFKIKLIKLATINRIYLLDNNLSEELQP